MRWCRPTPRGRSPSRVADCVPVLLADRRRRAVAAVHAGWRGTAARVVVAAVQALEREGVPASDLVAAIGPSIGPCCYQVDARVRDASLAGSPRAENGSRRMATGTGGSISGSPTPTNSPRPACPVTRSMWPRFCTADHLDDCFSYRKEGAAAGRLFGAIRLLPPIVSHPVSQSSIHLLKSCPRASLVRRSSSSISTSTRRPRSWSFRSLFFPASDPATATLASLATFGIAFLARPIGSALFGHFGDRVDERSRS